MSKQEKASRKGNVMKFIVGLGLGAVVAAVAARAAVRSAAARDPKFKAALDDVLERFRETTKTLRG